MLKPRSRGARNKGGYTANTVNRIIYPNSEESLYLLYFKILYDFFIYRDI